MIRVHMFVSGMVQGVFFRQFTVELAQEFDLKGWVKNTKDGRVEIVAEGEPQQFVMFIAKLKIGPESAEVNDIVIEEEKPTGEFKSFERR
jgi:acylphosphatase